MIDAVFNACVVFLLALADLLGTTYETINVWIFCVIEPIAFFALAGFAVYQARKIRQLIAAQEKMTVFNRHGHGLKPIILRCQNQNLSYCGDSESP